MTMMFSPILSARRVVALLVAVCACTAPAAAHAEFFGSSDAAPAALPPLAPFGDDNPSLAATLEIQRQIQILRRLLAREQAVNEMVAASLEIGVMDPFVAPPDLTLCQQIPANIPCSNAHADLYPGFRPEPPPVAPPTLGADTLAQELKGDGLMPMSLDDAPDGLGADNLYWTSVTCFQSVCSAVVTPDPDNTRARYHIRPGDALPDGTVVSAISATGVTLSAGDDIIALKPAPKPKPKEDKIEAGPFG